MGVRPWLAACDESSISGERFVGFGSLWMPYDRRGDFARVFRELQADCGAVGEMKWNKIKPGGRQRFAERIVDWFARSSQLSFHAYLIERARLDLSRHGGDLDLARRKHFTTFMANKIRRVIRSRGAGQTFYIWVDPIASRYAKADEATQVIASNMVGRWSARHRPDIRVTEHDSKEQPAIQLCDVLLGAVAASYNDKLRPGGAKALIADRLAAAIGWPDLVGDTKPAEREFNIWCFHDPVRDPVRAVQTRPVQLRQR